MNVGQLIRKLQTYPKNLKVAIAVHDNRDDEIQGIASCVDELAPGEAMKWHGKCVVIRS